MRIRDNDWIISQDSIKAVINFPEYSRHDCIWSIKTGLDGNIYFGLGAEGKGDSARLMVYEPATENVRELADLAVLCRDYLKPGKIPNSKVHFSLCVGKNGKIYGATHPTAPPPGEELFEPFGTLGHPEYGYTGSFLFSYDPKTDYTENLGLLCPNEGIRTMVLDKEKSTFYALTYPRVHFISFNLNTGEKKDYGRVAMTGSFDLFIDSKGRVFSTNDAGRLYIFDPLKDDIEELHLMLPSIRGRKSPYNFLFYPFRSLADDGWMYGGTYFDGHLFRFHPDKEKGGVIEDLGFGWGQEPDSNVWCAEYVQAPAFSKKNRIFYGFAGIWENVHLVCFDTISDEKIDLGRIKINGIESGWFSDSTTSDDGSTIYFADITMNGKARLLIFEPDDKIIEKSCYEQKIPSSSQFMPKQSPEIQEEFDLQASEIMPVSPPFRKNAFPYIEQGQLQIRELNFYDVSPAIPASECSIKSLVWGNNEKVYGITSGRKSHLFAYDPYPINDHVIDLATLDSTECCKTMLCDKSGIIYVATKDTGEIFSYDPQKDYSIFWTYKTNGIVKVASPVKGQGILTLCDKIISDKILGLSLDGKLFSTDIRTKKTRILCEVESDHLSEALVAVENKIYGAVCNGNLFEYDLDRNNLKVLNKKIPCGKGRDFQNQWTTAVCTSQGKIYGGTSEGNFFKFDPDALKLVNMGKPVMDINIRCLTRFVDGRIFGMAGAPGRIAHMFCYTPEDGSMNDLGIPAVNFPKPWVGYEFDAILTNPKGAIYLGESGRISHLFIYSPSPKEL